MKKQKAVAVVRIARTGLALGAGDQLLWEVLSQQYSTQSVSCNHYSVPRVWEGRAGAWIRKWIKDRLAQTETSRFREHSRDSTKRLLVRKSTCYVSCLTWQDGRWATGPGHFPSLSLFYRGRARLFSQHLQWSSSPGIGNQFTGNYTKASKGTMLETYLTFDSWLYFFKL